MKLPDESPKPAGLAFWFGLLLCVLILIGSFYNLANYPTIWWDEGIFSEAAANLVQHGRYAFTVQSPNQLSDLDFRISAGPAVILPVALAYKLFGVSLVSGRLVAGAYLVLTFLALFLGARRLWGSATALLAVALAFLGTDVLYWGRSVLGDIPALGLFLCATYFLIRGLESRALWPLFLGGIFLGLAFNAKEFYGLAFLPPLVLLAQQHWRDKRRLALSVLAFSAGAALPPLAYLALKAVILGSLTGAIVHFLEQKKLLCHEFFTPLTIGRIYPESLLLLLQDPLFWLGCLGVGWIWKKETPSPGVNLWIWNFFLWSAVYLTAVYWHRFALPALFLACPLAAYFLRKVAARLTSGVFTSSAPVAGARYHRRVSGLVLPRRRPGFLQTDSYLPGLSPLASGGVSPHPCAHPLPHRNPGIRTGLPGRRPPHPSHAVVFLCGINAGPGSAAQPPEATLRIQPGGGRHPDSGEFWQERLQAGLSPGPHQPGVAPDRPGGLL